MIDAKLIAISGVVFLMAAVAFYAEGNGLDINNVKDMEGLSVKFTGILYAKETAGEDKPGEEGSMPVEMYYDSTHMLYSFVSPSSKSGVTIVDYNSQAMFTFDPFGNPKYCNDLGEDFQMPVMATVVDQVKMQRLTSGGDEGGFEITNNDGWRLVITEATDTKGVVPKLFGMTLPDSCEGVGTMEHQDEGRRLEQAAPEVQKKSQSRLAGILRRAKAEKFAGRRLGASDDQEEHARRQLWGHAHWPHGHWPHWHIPHHHSPHHHSPHNHLHEQNDHDWDGSNDDHHNVLWYASTFSYEEQPVWDIPNHWMGTVATAAASNKHAFGMYASGVWFGVNGFQSHDDYSSGQRNFEVMKDCKADLNAHHDAEAKVLKYRGGNVGRLRTNDIVVAISGSEMVSGSGLSWLKDWVNSDMGLDIYQGPGTKGVYDSPKYSNWNAHKGKYHAGFYGYVETLYDCLHSSPDLRNAKFVVGHSLGASTAMLFAELESEQGTFAYGRPETVTWGQPRMYAHGYAGPDPTNWPGTRYFVEDDVVASSFEFMSGAANALGSVVGIFFGGNVLEWLHFRDFHQGGPARSVQLAYREQYLWCGSSGGGSWYDCIPAWTWVPKIQTNRYSWVVPHTQDAADCNLLSCANALMSEHTSYGDYDY